MPRECGLSVSLLQRLHRHYHKYGKACSFSLLQNYRSHSGLLMLPSSLFYRSTLQCNVPDSNAHPLAPFPLVFVCSSIDSTPSANAMDTDEEEAKILVDEVDKYVKSWPDEWGEREHSQDRVCIMTPSANQVKACSTNISSNHFPSYIPTETCYTAEIRIPSRHRCA